jgi:GT2 family glycosyltransferase/glycosyltransferase involved in cell wall biosynthesis
VLCSSFEPILPRRERQILSANFFQAPLRLAARAYRALPIPQHFRYLLNQVLLGKLYFLTRHVLRATTPKPRPSLERALARLGEVQRNGPGPLPRFARPEVPEVSIIIPVFNQARYTALCLQSIAESETRRSFEVLVVDDASTDSTPAMLQRYENLRILRNTENAGFNRSCNRGAREARGRLLLFLNNDTWVVPGWLDALADSLDAVETAGLAGSKLVYPDGLLQEAGGIIWNDATGWNYGNRQDPDRPEFNYRRDVDFCSGASIMVPRDLFLRLDGFDARFAPAYYEDADLAFSVRAAGLRVLYQPMSEVIHFEGATSGRDVRQGIKAYQVANRRKFLEKWSAVLANHRAPGESPRLEKERSVRRRVLVIDSRTPTPDKDAGSADTVNYMRLLQGLGFKVTFIPADNFFADGRYTSALQEIGVECLYSPHLASVNAHLAEQGMDYDLVFLCRANNAARHVENVRRYCPKARIVFYTVDLHFLREQRQAKLQGSAALARAAVRTRQLELRTMRLSDATIVLSRTEHELLVRELPGASFFVIPLLCEIPGRSVAYAPRRDILFIGGYEHLPNVDAVRYFAAEIWPLVRRRLPEAVFLVLGSNPPAEVLSLEGDGITVVGYVEQLPPYFNRCRLSVAPLRYGAGIKGKIATSLGFGVPCVATRIAVEGMGLTDGRETLVADSPEAFADAVVRVYSEESLWSSLSDQGLQFLEREMSLTVGREKLRAMLVHLNVLTG